MGASVQPVPDANVAMVQLASRIAAHLHDHPKDRQALDDLHYVVGQMAGTAASANATDAAAAKEGGNLGVIGTTAQRAGNAASFGAGDAIGRALEGPQYQAIVDESVRRNPVSAVVGNIAGGTAPYLLSGGSTLAARTAIGAAQGLGLTDGGIGRRVAGGIIGAGGAAVSPVILRGAGALVRGTVGRVLGRLLPAAAESGATAATAAEGRVAALMRANPQLDRQAAENVLAGLKQSGAPAEGAVPVSSAPVGDPQMPGSALHDAAGNPIPGSEVPPGTPPFKMPSLLRSPDTPVPAVLRPQDKVRDAARTAFNLHLAATGDAAGANEAGRRAAAVATNVFVPTGSPELPLGGALTRSKTLMTILAKGPTEAARNELLSFVATLPAGEYEQANRIVFGNQAWRAALDAQP